MGERHPDGRALPVSDQLHGPLLQDEVITPREITKRRATQQTGYRLGAEKGMEHVPLPLPALLEQPSFDGGGHVTRQHGHRRMLPPVETDGGHAALRPSGERIQHRNPRGGERPHALGEMLERRDAERRPLPQRATDGVGAEKIFGVAGPGHVMPGFEFPREHSVADDLRQQPGLVVVEEQPRLRVRDDGPHSIEHGTGRPDERAVPVQLHRIPEIELVRNQTRRAASPPRSEDGRAHLSLDRLPIEEALYGSLVRVHRTSSGGFRPGGRVPADPPPLSAITTATTVSLYLTYWMKTDKYPMFCARHSGYPADLKGSDKREPRAAELVRRGAATSLRHGPSSAFTQGS